MAQYVFTTTESTSQAQSQTVTISDLSLVNNVTVNTGSVTYTVSGKDVTVNVDNGATSRVVSGNQTITQTDTRSCTVTQPWVYDGDQWVTNGSATDNAPASVPAKDGLTGTLYKTTVDGTPSPPSDPGTFNQQTNTSIGGTAHYSGQATGDTTTYYYQYTVTIDYVQTTTTYGTIDEVSANENNISIRIKDLEFGSGYTQLTITMGSTTIPVTIAGNDGVAYYTSTATFSGLTPLTSYDFTAHFTQSGQPAGTSSASYSTTAHVNVPPTLNFSSIDGTNSIKLTFSGYDEDGLRASNTYALYISGADNTTFGSPVYVTDTRNNVNLSYTFLKDGTGVDFIIGKTYTARVILYDNINQSSQADKSVVFSKAKPGTFDWTNAKTTESEYNLTADEWTTFIDDVNDYLSYKGLTPLTFNKTIVPGILSYVIPTANSFNMAISGLNMAGATTLPPNNVSTGTTVTAYLLNRMRDSLNSIP